MEICDVDLRQIVINYLEVNSACHIPWGIPMRGRTGGRWLGKRLTQLATSLVLSHNYASVENYIWAWYLQSEPCSDEFECGSQTISFWGGSMKNVGTSNQIANLTIKSHIIV